VTPSSGPPSYGYDPRRGAAAYAPIIGGICGFVVTAVVVVFTVRPSGHAADPTMLALATGLLVLGLISCLLSSFIFAAIGAERELTVNLTPAALLAGSAAAIGIVAIMGAFEVLAAIYLPAAKELFAIITVGTELGATAIVASVLGDAWLAPKLTPYNTTPQWLKEPADAKRAGLAACASCATVIALGGVLHFAGVRVDLGKAGTNVFIGSGIGLSLVLALGGLFRTIHAEDGNSHGLKPAEAVAVLGVLCAYLAVLTVSLP
jgi:hypothetical protein